MYAPHYSAKWLLPRQLANDALMHWQKKFSPRQILVLCYIAFSKASIKATHMLNDFCPLWVRWVPSERGLSGHLRESGMGLGTALPLGHWVCRLRSCSHTKKTAQEQMWFAKCTTGLAVPTKHTDVGKSGRFFNIQKLKLIQKWTPPQRLAKPSPILTMFFNASLPESTGISLCLYIAIYIATGLSTLSPMNYNLSNVCCTFLHFP